MEGSGVFWLKGLWLKKPNNTTNQQNKNPQTKKKPLKNVTNCNILACADWNAKKGLWKLLTHSKKICIFEISSYVK